MELHVLLKRLRRSSPGGAGSATGATPSPQSRPPDEGSAALGIQLGSAFGSELLDCVSSSSTSDDTANTLRKTGCDIIDALSEAPSTSFAYGYSQGIHKRLCGDTMPPASLSAALETMLPWWLTWIEQSNPAIRGALIRGYIHLTNVLVSAKDSDPNTSTPPQTEQMSYLADAYSKLERGIDRRFLLRECIAVSFFQLRNQVKDDGDSAGVAVITNLSGLVARCMLLPTDARSTDGAAGFNNRDGSLFWTLMIRECRLFISSMAQSFGRYCANAMAKIIPWLVKSFHMYTLRLSWNDDIAADEAFGLFQQLCDLLCDLSSAMRGLIKDDSRIICPALEESYKIAMGEILCRFSMSGTVSVTPCIVQLSEAMCISVSHDVPAKNHWKVSEVVIFRLASLVLNTPDMFESKQILESIYLMLQEGCFDEACDRLVLIGSVRALGRIFVSVKSHATIATKLSSIADKIEKEVDYEKENGSNLFTAHEHIVRFFQTPKSSSGEFKRSGMLSKLIVPVTPELTSSLEQVCVFLIASSLLCIKTNDGDRTTGTFDLLRQIVERWPYLGIRSIPLATSFVQGATDEEDSNVGGVISALHFLCSATAIDPSSAQQVWSIISGLTEHPSVVRSASIRMFPLLCKANRKLYGRVRDCLGRYCSSPDVKTRISATATLCDLARDDLIRDVSDVIGWLQGCLNDEEAIVVYYVIMTLHHFIHAGELDFDVVIKVISKKLVQCDDLASILELSPIVVESLVVLLGDGAQSVSDDSGEDDSSDEADGISLQVKRAVSTLLALAQEYQRRVDDDAESEPALRILDLVYSSLSGYNIDELGVDADALRTLTTCELDPSEPESGVCPNYSILKRVVMDGLVKSRPDLPLASDSTENRKNLQLLATTILEFEEDTLGPSLWKKQSAPTQSSPSTKTKKQKVSKSILAALPSAELLQSLYEENPSTGTAIARMFCLGEKSLSTTQPADEIIDILADVLPDLNFAEIVDPIVMVLYYGSWLEAGKTLWTRMSSPDSNFTADAATVVMQQLEDLKETDHDNSLIALSAFCCVTPETHKGVDLTFVGEKVFGKVLHAHNGHDFTDSNAAMVAFGLLGSRFARSMAIDRVGQILDVLDDSGTDAKSFSALMSFALIARSLSSSLLAIGKTDVASSAALKMIGRIFALLVEEYHAYLDAPLPSILTLVASLRTGKTCPNLLDSLQEIEESAFSLADSSHLQMKGVLIVLSVALPALGQLDSILLEGISVVLAKSPWNIGKGYALASAYKTLADQNLLKSEDMDSAYAAAVKDPSESALFAAFTIAQLMPDNNHDKKNEALSMMNRAIGSDNKGITLDDILNACLSVGTLPLMSDLDGPQLHLETTKSALVATVEILSANATDQHAGGVCRDMSAIVLGILCCMKHPRQSAMTVQGSNLGKETRTTKKVNELPSPRPFTLLYDAVGFLRKELLDSSGDLSQKDSMQSMTLVCDLIRCIGKIPLPAPFAILIKSIVNQVDADEGHFAVKDACIDMMVSQIESERHSGSNRAEFISLSLQIAKSPPEQFWSLFQSTGNAAAERKGMGRFMETISSFITKWPSGVVEETIENLWAICAFDMTHQASFANASLFLKSLSFALRRCNDMDLDRKSRDDKSSRSLLSPVALKSIHSLLINSILRTIVNFLPGQEHPKDTGGNVSSDVWSSYLACLEQIPASILNDADFFVLSTNQGGGFDDTIARILIVAHMVRRNADYFGTQTERHLMKAQLWIARQRVSSLTKEQLKSIRVAMIYFGGATSACTTASQEYRKEIILQCFETMLLNGLDSLALECLAVQCGSWCSRFTSGSSAIEAHEAASSMSRVLTRGDLGSALAIGVPSSFEISTIIGFFVRDMPWRLGLICRELGGTATGLFANRCLRILQGVDLSSTDQLEEPYDLHNAVLFALKDSATCCSEIDANGLAYTTFYLDEMVSFGG